MIIETLGHLWGNRVTFTDGATIKAPPFGTNCGTSSVIFSILSIYSSVPNKRSAPNKNSAIMI